MFLKISFIFFLCMHAVLYIYSAIGWPSRGMFGIAPGIFSWPLLYLVVLLWIGVGKPIGVYVHRIFFIKKGKEFFFVCMRFRLLHCMHAFLLLLLRVCCLYTSPGLMLHVLLAGFKASLFPNIA